MKNTEAKEVLVHALPEGGAEGAVAVVAALLGQLLLAMSGAISFGF